MRERPLGGAGGAARPATRLYPLVMANSAKTGEHPDAATAVTARIAATLIFLVTPDINFTPYRHDSPAQGPVAMWGGATSWPLPSPNNNRG
ncbi:hypothetical protein MSG_00806 [Mycobacterium shigaense]|uniref:Uncharacterized protein n=1 Tax=Mycobacterium shigaense TaxID=722731 RepID=A0A1Z4EDF0_9MYCO|nr:hypothetical protein MSG_00806 [Mycobacterium shigaense]